MQGERIFNLLERSFEKRKKLFQSTNAVRLVNGKGDGLPGLTIDQYVRHFLVKVFDPAWNAQLEAIRDFLLNCFNPQYLVFKDGSPEKTRAIYENLTFAQTISKTVVTENGLRFLVDLDDHLNTGLFLDMRENRKRVGGLAKGKSVLNTFAYTSSFGVYARAFGAREVTNVDVSQKFLEWGQKNYELNNIHFSEGEFVRKDANEYLKRAIRRNYFFDVVILDPPSFSRFENKIFSVRENFSELIRQAVQVLNPQGYLFVATNLSTVSLGLLKAWVKKGAFQTERTLKKMTPLGQDRDFRGSGTMKESCLSALLADVE
ncbi:MAG: class I SAM-dependent rRNA methyltransferase [Chlamydiae bacterium]|nr:class I SAM-dependent rRNA methyltransferase [Chlamydiota bacterium]